MSARFDPASGAQLSRAMVEEILNKLERWLTADGLVPAGIDASQAAEITALQYLLSIAYDRRGADGVMGQMLLAYQSGFGVLSHHGQVPDSLASMATALGVRP